MERASIRVPVYDLLDWLQFYGNRMAAGDWLGYLWTPHNEHRIVFSRILLALDVRWFRGRGTAFVLSGFVLLAATAAVISREIAKSGLSTKWKLVAIPISILLLTPAHIVVTLGMPAMSVFLQTSAFALYSLVLLGGAGKETRFPSQRAIAAIAAACLAAFGVSAGLVIWPALLWVAWRDRLRAPWIATIACAGALFVAVYLKNLPLRYVSAPLDFADLLLSFDYVIRFLGLPWSHLHALVWPARLVGLATLCLGCFALVTESVAPRPGTRLKRIGLGLVLFAFLVAASAPLARLDVAPTREMPIRYGMFLVVAQLGLLLWSLEFLQRVWEGAHHLAFQWLLLVGCVAWIAQQVVVGHAAVVVADHYKSDWARFVAGKWTPDMLHYVYPDRKRALAKLEDLRKMGLYSAKQELPAE